MLLFLLGMLAGGFLTYAFFSAPIRDGTELRKANRLQEERMAYINELAEPFLEHRFIELLIAKIRNGGDQNLIESITVTKTGAEIAVVHYLDPITIPYHVLGYQDLEDEDILPIACALFLNLGDPYEPVYDQEHHLLPVIHRRSPKTRKLKPVRIK